MKKGFTLVELLITVVILGLIISVSIPVVNVVMKNQEEKRFSYHEEVVLESSKAYKELFSNKFEEKTDAICYEIDYKKLLKNDLIKEDTITCDEDESNNLGGKIQLEKSGNGYVYKPYLTCKNKKTNTIVSNNKGTHRQDCQEASDYFIITKLIVKEVNKDGVDYNGNWINKDIYVEVKANDPYMVGIKAYEYSVDNGTTWNKMTGNNHTFKNDLNEDIIIRAVDNTNKVAEKTRTIKIDKTAPTCASSGGSSTWINTNKTLTGTCNDGGSGCTGNVTKLYTTNTNLINISPGVVLDKAGNSTTCPANQTVKIDKTAPTCASSGGSTTWTNGNRTLTGTCSDTGGSGCAGNVSISYTSNTNQSSVSPGVVKDIAGNTTTCPANQTVRIDKTPPTCSSSGGSSTWTNGNRTLTGTCSDSGGSGCAGNITKSYTSNTNQSSLSPGVVKDNAGNTVTCPANQTVRIDKTAPTCASSGGSSTWTNGNRTITGTCSDTGGSGCASATVTKTYSSNINSTSQSPGVVKDKAGNSTTCPANRTVRIDKTAPTCSSSGGSTTWTNGNRTLTGTCSDSGGSGCAGNVSKSYTSNTNQSSISPGVIRDNAGNTTTCPANQTVRIDKTAPTCTSSGGSSTWTNGNRTITGTCSDSGGSGCASSTVTKTFSSNINSTTQTPGVVKDNAGNSTTCPANRTVRIDKTPPTCSSSGGSATWTNGTRVLTGTCSDTGGSGCTGNVTGTWSAQRNQTNVSPGTVYDNAGNSVVCPSNQTVRIDKTAPTCSVTYTRSSTTELRAVLTCSDTGGSGMRDVAYLYRASTTQATYSEMLGPRAGSSYTSTWSTSQANPPSRTTSYYFHYGGRDNVGNIRLYRTPRRCSLSSGCVG